MSFEYFAKYNRSERKPVCATIDEPVVIFLGLTISDLCVAVVSFLVMAMFFDSPFTGLSLGLICAYLRKAYAKKYPRGTVVQTLWAKGLLKKRFIPNFFQHQSPAIYGR